MKRAAALALILFAALSAAPSAFGGDRVVLTFAPTNPKPGREVVVRAVSTTSGARVVSDGRVEPAPLRGSGSLPAFEQPVEVFLVPSREASSVVSRGDPRLIRIGILRPEGELRFKALDLADHPYAAVVSCPSCAAAENGRTLFPIGVGPNTNGLTPLMLLRPHGFDSGPRVAWPFVLFVGAVLSLLALAYVWRRKRPGRSSPTQSEAIRA